MPLLWIIVVVLVLFAVLGLPHWPYAAPYHYGYYPSGIIGVVVLVLVLLLLLGRI